MYVLFSLTLSTKLLALPSSCISQLQPVLENSFHNNRTLTLNGLGSPPKAVKWKASTLSYI